MKELLFWYLFIGFINAIVEIKYMYLEKNSYSFFDYIFSYIVFQFLWGFSLYYNYLKPWYIRKFK
jgi:hypothetical protein